MTLNEQVSYQDYVGDERHMREYSEYQKRYASQLRESDRVLISILEGVVEGTGGPLKVLDVGCSTGNLLLHLKHSGLELELAGADIVEAAIEDCRANPALSGVSFQVLDMLELEPDPCGTS